MNISSAMCLFAIKRELICIQIPEQLAFNTHNNKNIISIFLQQH